MGDVWSLEQGRGCWNYTFMRHFNDLEMRDVERLLSCLREKKELLITLDGRRQRMLFSLLSSCTRLWSKDHLFLF